MIVEILPINVSNETRDTYYRTYSAYIATSAMAATYLRVRMPNSLMMCSTSSFFLVLEGFDEIP